MILYQILCGTEFLAESVSLNESIEQARELSIERFPSHIALWVKSDTVHCIVAVYQNGEILFDRIGDQRARNEILGVPD